MPRDPRTSWNDAEPEDAAAADFFRPRIAGAQTAPCPPPELVQASRVGALPPVVQENVDGHVEHCVVCQALADALDDPSLGSLTADEHDRILERVHKELDRSHRTSARGWWGQLSAAAAVVAIVTVGSVLIWQPWRGRQPDASSVFQLDKPAIHPRAATELVWRGSDSPAAEDLNRALVPFYADDFSEAARRLRTLVSRHPQSASGHFYLGVSDLFLAADGEAVTALENAERLAKDDTDLAREAAWYLTLAYRRTGQIARATEKLQGLCRSGRARAARACAGLDELSTGSSVPRSR